MYIIKALRKIDTSKRALLFSLKVAVLATIGANILSFIYFPTDEYIRNLPIIMTIPILLGAGLSLSISVKMKKINWMTKQLRHALDHDNLTGVMTRERFYQALDELALPGIVMLVDIDNFKSVNDTHGHFVGDVALVQVASLLQSNVRRNDLVCRYGGEEFILFFPATDRSSAIGIAERVRKQIANTPVICGDVTLNVTISMGVSNLGQDEEFDRALRRADTMMYRAKDKGRNRLCSDHDDLTPPT